MGPKSTIFLWPLEIGICTFKSTKLCGPLSWGCGLPTHNFFVALSVGDMDSKPTYSVARGVEDMD